MPSTRRKTSWQTGFFCGRAGKLWFALPLKRCLPQGQTFALAGYFTGARNRQPIFLGLGFNPQSGFMRAFDIATHYGHRPRRFRSNARAAQSIRQANTKTPLGPIPALGRDFSGLGPESIGFGRAETSFLLCRGATPPCVPSRQGPIAPLEVFLDVNPKPILLSGWSGGQRQRHGAPHALLQQKQFSRSVALLNHRHGRLRFAIGHARRPPRNSLEPPRLALSGALPDLQEVRIPPQCVNPVYEGAHGRSSSTSSLTTQGRSNGRLRRHLPRRFCRAYREKNLWPPHRHGRALPPLATPITRELIPVFFFPPAALPRAVAACN